LIKADGGNRRAVPPLLRLAKTPICFNELYLRVNEKIRAANASQREQLCPKTMKSSMELLCAHNVP
jgi:hypothetical protein